MVIALEAAGKAPEEEWFSTRVFVTHIRGSWRGAFAAEKPGGVLLFKSLGGRRSGQVQGENRAAGGAEAGFELPIVEW